MVTRLRMSYLGGRQHDYMYMFWLVAHLSSSIPQMKFDKGIQMSLQWTKKYNIIAISTKRVANRGAK